MEVRGTNAIYTLETQRTEWRVTVWEYGFWSSSNCNEELAFVCSAPVSTFLNTPPATSTTSSTATSATTSSIAIQASNTPNSIVSRIKATQLTTSIQEAARNNSIAADDDCDGLLLPIVIGAVCAAVVVFSLVQLVTVLVVCRKRKQTSSSGRAHIIANNDGLVYQNSPSVMSLQENDRMSEPMSQATQVQNTSVVEYEAINEVSRTYQALLQSDDHSTDNRDGLYTICDNSGLPSSQVANAQSTNMTGDHTYDAVVDVVMD